MKKTIRRILAMFTAVMLLFGFMPELGIVSKLGFIPENFASVTVKADDTKTINASDLSNGTITENKEINGFTLTKDVTIDDNAKTLESGTPVTKRIKFSGAGSISSKSIIIKATEATKITTYAVSSGDATRYLGLFKDDGTLVSQQEVKAAGSIIPAQEFEIEEAGTYYFASVSAGINIYYISMGQMEEIQRTPWSSVMTPSLTSASDNGAGKITVNYSMKIGSRVEDACDKLDIIMYDKDGKEVTRESVAKKGDSGSVEFTPTASGTYTFKAEASRKAETDVKTSNSISAGFVLPLATPVVRAMTADNNGTMKILWGNVPEAESYDVYIKTNLDYELIENVKASSGTDSSATKQGLTKGNKYDFKVIAKRGSDVSAAGEVTGCIVRNEAERDWIASRFGTSTSDEANRVEGNIYDGLKLYSCTYKDNGSIDKKGGKLNASDPYDGITYYYTKVDPTKENFVITGTFTIDYLNPTPDGQEGFGIIVRDSVGKNGDNSCAYYTNSATAIASKVQYTNDDGAVKSIKDGIGYRFYSGVTSATDTPKTGQVNVVSGAFDKKLTIKQGESYTFTVKMDNTGYRVIYKDSSGNEQIQTLYGKSKLLQIDKENVYVGFASARGCNVTVKDISFTTSNPSTDPADEGEPAETVASIYTISSSSTSGSKKYNFTFSANADGRLVVKKGDSIVVKETEIKAGEDFTKEVSLSKGENKFTATFTPNADYTPGDNKVMDSYETVNVGKTVTYKSYGKSGEKIIVSPDGNSEGKGTQDSPLDIETAIKFVQPGQQIICKAGTYKLNDGIKVENGIDGTKDKRIYLLSDPEDDNAAIFDFQGKGKGFTFWGDYWYVKGIAVTNTADGQKGIQVAGNNNVFELVKTYKNGNTGLQISGQSTDPFEKWPANNLILNCTSYNNSDAAMEDADGFAAKLTVGEGNVFYGCLAYNNADDGWDCFAKTATGPIGAVTVINSVAYKNGYLLDGKEAGNGNGFKMGGSALSGHHVLKNCYAYNNKAKGLDSNSCPDIEIYDCTSYNNKSYNVALYSNTGITTAFKADGIISYKDAATEVSEQLKLSGQDALSTANNFFWTEVAAANAKEQKGTTANASWFESTKTTMLPTRNDDGTLNMGQILKLTSKAPSSAGARIDNEEYSMDKILEQMGVSRDIPKARDISSSNVSIPFIIGIIAVIVIIAAIMAAVIVISKKKNKNKN